MRERDGGVFCFAHLAWFGASFFWEGRGVVRERTRNDEKTRPVAPSAFAFDRRNRNRPQKFGNPTEAKNVSGCQAVRMNRFDWEADETWFWLVLPAKGPVYLVGDFNRWEVGRTPMRWRDGLWQVAVCLAPGRYRYGFSIRGALLRDREATAQETRHGWPWSLVVVPRCNDPKIDWGRRYPAEPNRPSTYVNRYSRDDRYQFHFVP